MGWTVRIVLGVLATWWLAAMLYYGNGPLNFFARLRGVAWGWLGADLDCFWCCAFWAAAIVTPLAVWLPGALLPFAFAGATILLAHGGRVIWREMNED